MKSILAIAIALGIGHAAQADTTYTACSTADTKITIVGDKVVYKANAMMGEQKIQLKTADLNMSEQVLVHIDSIKHEMNTYCGKSYTVTQDFLVKHVTFSKKDGSNIFTDDTPASDVKEVLVKVLCEVRTVGAWTCD